MNSLVNMHVKAHPADRIVYSVDLEKAFDSTWHAEMLRELQNIGIRGICYDLVNNTETNSAKDTTDSF